jgi:hypothetical protein
LAALLSVPLFAWPRLPLPWECAARTSFSVVFKACAAQSPLNCRRIHVFGLREWHPRLLTCVPCERFTHPH